MKRLLLSLNLLLGLALAGQAQLSSTFDFPIKPGDEQWNSFASVQDRVNALQIPEETLMNLSTHDLLNVSGRFTGSMASIDTSGWIAGIYVVSAKVEGKVLTEKIIIK